MNKLLTEEDCETLWISKDQYEWISLASEFSYTIKKAKNEIEMFNEEKLIRWNNVAGVIFNLTNNYWRKNRQYIDAKTDNTNKNENTHSGEVKFVMEYAPPTDWKWTPQPDDVLSDNDW